MRRAEKELSGSHVLRRAGACGVVLAAIAIAASSLFASSAQATIISIPDNPLLGVDANKLMLVSPSGSPLGYGNFSVQLIPNSVQYVDPPYENAIGQRIQSSYNVTFGRYDALPNIDLEHMLVFTSIRYGNPATVTCGMLGPGGTFPRADFEYLPGDPNGFTGDVDRITTSNDSMFAGESQVCNAEGPEFSSSLIFAAQPGEADPTYTFTMQISQTAVLSEELPEDTDDMTTGDIVDLKFLLQGYSAPPPPIPEPTTGVMLLLGLVGLHGYARSKRRHS